MFFSCRSFNVDKLLTHISPALVAKGTDSHVSPTSAKILAASKLIDLHYNTTPFARGMTIDATA